jgi:glycosyltransferase involved in cell wall biosynthesis
MTARVLMTTDAVGGVFTYALELAAALAPLGVELNLASMGRPASRAQRQALARAPVASYREGDFPLEWSDSPWEGVDRAGGWLLELEAELRPDVVHLNGYVHGALAWRAPCAVVAHSCVLSWWRAVRGEDAPAGWDEYRRRVRDGLALADAVVAPSQWMLRALARHYGCRRGTVIANGRSDRWVRPTEKEPLVLAAGRIWDEGKDLAVLAAAARRSPWPVLIAGDAAGAGAAVAPGGAQLLGEVAPHELQRLMLRAAIFAHPARYEPFGLAVLEAAQAGCALVLGDIPSLREIWGDSALYVPVHDPDALAACLGELAGDTGRVRALGRQARERSRRYGADAMALRYAGLYRHLLGARTAA